MLPSELWRKLYWPGIPTDHFTEISGGAFLVEEVNRRINRDVYYLYQHTNGRTFRFSHIVPWGINVEAALNQLDAEVIEAKNVTE